MTALTAGSHATIHVFRWGIGRTPSVEELRSRDPDFAPRRGDIIVNADESGYRSQGMVFFDGTSIVGQAEEFDDYGSPPVEFLVGTEFPAGYWDLSDSSHGEVKHYDGLSPGDYDMPYWHSGDSPPTPMPRELIVAALEREPCMRLGDRLFGIYIDTKFGRYLMVSHTSDVDGFLQGDDADPYVGISMYQGPLECEYPVIASSMM